MNREDIEIMFGDTSEDDIDERNPLYTILYSMDESNKYFSRTPIYTGHTGMKKYTKREFAKEMNRYFANK